MSHMFVRDLRCVAKGSECISNIWHGITRSLANWFRSWDIWSILPLLFSMFSMDPETLESHGKPPWFTMMTRELQNHLSTGHWKIAKTNENRALNCGFASVKVKSELSAPEPNSRRMGRIASRRCCGNNPLTNGTLRMLASMANAAKSTV